MRGCSEANPTSNASPNRVVSGRPRRGRPRPAALFGRARHQRDAQVDPGALRRGDRHAHGRPRPAGRGLGRRARARRSSSGRVETVARRRPRGVRERLRAAGDQGERPLRGRLSALHGARTAADRRSWRSRRPASTAATRSPTAAPARATIRSGSRRRSRRSTRSCGSSPRCASGRWAARRRSPMRASRGSR